MLSGFSFARTTCIKFMFADIPASDRNIMKNQRGEKKRYVFGFTGQE